MSATAETPAPANTDKYTGVFVVDVEATDKTPMTGVMVEFAVVHLVTGASFYARLYASHPNPDMPALPVVERDAAGRPVVDAYVTLGTPRASGGPPRRARADIAALDADPLIAVAKALRDWLSTFEVPRRSLVSDNNGYDAMWLNCFTDEVLGEVLFGHSSRRIGDFFAGTQRNWSSQSRWKALRRTPHNHDPLDDATGNVEALRVILALD